jgi:hypothetical protein
MRGMQAIGLDRHTRALAGWGHNTMGSSSMQVTGTEIVDAWTTITARTANRRGTSVTATRIVTRIMATRVAAEAADHTSQRMTAGADSEAPAQVDDTA